MGYFCGKICNQELSKIAQSGRHTDQHHFYRFKTERVGEGDAKARQNARRTGRERGEFSFRGVDPRTGGEKGQAGLRRGKSGERSQSGARQIDIDSLNAGKILIINFSEI